MTDARFSPSDSQPNRALPTSDDELRVTMAALATASAHPAMPPTAYIALIEQKRYEMVLPDGHEIACVFFTCGDQRWGVRLSDVRRILPQLVGPPVALPNSPPWVAGIFRIEAEFATLIDTARFLGGTPSLPQRPQRDQAILVIAQNDALIGLFVTNLSLATTIQDTEWQAAWEDEWDQQDGESQHEYGREGGEDGRDEARPYEATLPNDLPLSTAVRRGPGGAASQPYLLARYVPAEKPCNGAEGALGFLDVTRIAAACLAELDGEDDDDDA